MEEGALEEEVAEEEEGVDTKVMTLDHQRK